MSLAELVEAKQTLYAAPEAESTLRSQYLLLNTDEEDPAVAGDLLPRSAAFLELFLVSIFLIEVLDELRAKTFGESGQDATYFVGRVRDMFGLEVGSVLEEAHAQLGMPWVTTRETPSISLSGVLRAARSILEVCPVELLERLGSSTGLEPLGHRIRFAYDAIKALVIRCDPHQQNRLRIIGTKYVEGTMELSELSTLMGLHPVDAVALLEEQGFYRSVDRVRLSDARRSSILGRIRTCDASAGNGQSLV
jgi:hypothetical protein